MSQSAALAHLHALGPRGACLQASAPGRVNLIGEHTDYSGGYVLPLALTQRTYVALALNQGAEGRLYANSREQGAAEASLEAPATGSWTDYLVGAVQQLRALGGKVRSLHIGLASDVPLGAGVSSSAALEVATLRALRQACQVQISDVALAYAAQRIENAYLGLKTGIMDPMAASLGTAGAPLLFDTHSGHTETLPLFSRAVFLTFHSGVSRRLVDGAYNQRRAATDAALKALGVPRLVGLSAKQIESLTRAIRPRVRHVVTENARVLAAVEALRADDPVEFGALMQAAHASMRDDFAASHEQVDAQVKAALAAGALGARITGAGFGGCFVVLAWAQTAAQIRTALLRQFPTARHLG